MTPKYLYTVVTSNRYNIHEKLQVTEPLYDKKQHDNKPTSDTNPELSLDTDEDNIYFKITLSNVESDRIKPQTHTLYKPSV